MKFLKKIYQTLLTRSSVGEGRFSHHEPCPNCGSKDNLGVWADGHKFCFGCKHFEPSPQSLANLRKRLAVDENNNNNGNGLDRSHCTPILPARSLAWLRKYGITDKEITSYGIWWNPQNESLVFPVRNQAGQLVLTNERYFGADPKHPKYLTFGSKTAQHLIILHPLNRDSLVVVEDFISAVKVARQVSSCALFGSTMPGNALKWAVERFKHIRVWLDMDKASQSVLTASRCSQYVPDTRSIITEMDPKDYTNSQISKILISNGIVLKSDLDTK